MLDFDPTLEITEPAHEAADGLNLVVAGEVAGAEVAVRDVIAGGS